MNEKNINRSTTRNEKGRAYYCDINGKSESDIRGNIYGEASDKLAHYEDLEEQGKLMRLPCAYGDTVYVIDCDKEKNFSIVETTIYEIRINCNGLFLFPDMDRPAFRPWDFGDTVFLTREEADIALKEEHNG